MQYQVTKEKSAEYLRQAINHMSLQDAAFHPVSYAVWYEYSSGEHAKLIDEVNVLIEKERKLNEKSTAYLYHKHIANLDADSAKEIVDRFNKVVSDITHTTAKTGKDTSQFKQVLDTWSTEIQKLDQAIGDQMSGLIAETTHMQQLINTLQSQLESSLHEVASLKNEIIKAKQEALSDGLTGLMNRKAFDHVLNDCVTTNGTEETCLVIADIDFFKHVNDTYGHLFGNKVIQAVANILKSASGFQFTAARYGGEEFVLLLPNASLKIAQQTAEKIRQLVEKIKIKNNVTNRLVSNITISLGIAQYRHGESVDAFITRADQALYMSKAKGRNQVTIVTETLMPA